jgi:hypothetical protein
VLLSENYRFFGKAKGTNNYKEKLPALAAKIESKHRKYLINHSPEVLSDLQNLKEECWRH